MFDTRLPALVMEHGKYVINMHGDCYISAVTISFISITTATVNIILASNRKADLLTKERKLLFEDFNSACFC